MEGELLPDDEVGSDADRKDDLKTEEDDDPRLEDARGLDVFPHPKDVFVVVPVVLHYSKARDDVEVVREADRRVLGQELPSDVDGLVLAF